MDTHVQDHSNQGIELARISHDLKSPMNAILGAAELLELMFEDAELNRLEALRVLSLIRESGVDMMLLIRSIVSIGKHAAQNGRIESVDVCDTVLSDELLRVTETFGHEAAAKGIRLELGPLDLPKHVHWDIGRIHCQALNNLVSNALRYTPRGGRVVIRSRMEAGRVCLLVADDGPGIPPELRATIFDPFSGGDPAAFASVGLGLYNAASVVRAHGGEIRVIDHPEFAGAAFEMLIPLTSPRDQEEGLESSRGRRKLDWRACVTCKDRPACVADEIRALAS